MAAKSSRAAVGRQCERERWQAREMLARVHAAYRPGRSGARGSVWQASRKRCVGAYGAKIRVSARERR